MQHADPSEPHAMPLAEPPLDRLRHRLEAQLAAALPLPHDAHDTVAHAMRAAVLSPGKRLRPMLLLTATAALGADADAALDAACALEFVHAASLVLDDLPCMDDASLRRGRPTLHRQFGVDIASLAVVALLSQACRLVAAAPALDAEVRARMVVVLADAAGHPGLVSGQWRDLRSRDAAAHEGDASLVNRLKTGALFRAAFEMAVLAAGAGDTVHDALQRCADEIGQAFQLLDDLKDSGEAPCTGKDLHQDRGKPTLLALIGPEAARERLRHHLAAGERLLHLALGDPAPVLAELQRAISVPA